MVTRGLTNLLLELIVSSAIIIIKNTTKPFDFDARYIKLNYAKKCA